MEIEQTDATIHTLPHESRVKINNRLYVILTTYGIYKYTEDSPRYMRSFVNTESHKESMERFSNGNNIDFLKKLDFHLLPYKYFHIFYFVNKINLIVDYYNYIQNKWKQNYIEVEKYINSLFDDSIDSQQYEDIYECVFDYLYNYSKNNKPQIINVPDGSYDEKLGNFVYILETENYKKYCDFLSQRINKYCGPCDYTKLRGLIKEQYNKQDKQILEENKIKALKNCFNIKFELETST